MLAMPDVRCAVRDVFVAFLSRGSAHFGYFRLHVLFKRISRQHDPVPVLRESREATEHFHTHLAKHPQFISSLYEFQSCAQFQMA